jgi:hypothetical protein
VRVVWKGDLLPKRLEHDLNDEAKSVMDEFGIPFVNVSRVFQYVPRYDKHKNRKGIKGISKYTADQMHFGSIARGDHDGKINGAISMLITQMVLDRLCESSLGKLPSQSHNKKQPYWNDKIWDKNDLKEKKKLIAQQLHKGR